ncbi:putative HlyD family secretion protein [Pseudohongiella spirulinae]|uniref:Putative HlyD family secretion protein n=2 Tax=Pseudohongiella spirulinae TaxID=1249552 RepID=A0A0S2KHP8_9GAMM|nr:putative HlyD family secretion protein [Pseudohongiella spirulinae]
MSAALVFVVLVRTPERLPLAAPDQAIASVRVAEVSSGIVQLDVQSQGRVQASRRVSLSAATAGPVSWVSPSLVAGGYFSKDEVILRVDSSDYETALERARSGLSQAQSDARFAREELERNTALADQRLISETQLRDLQRQAENTSLRVRDAQAAVAQAELDLRRSEIRAPFNTIVESTSIDIGQQVGRGAALAILLHADEVEIRLPLAINQLDYLDLPLGIRGEIPAELQPDVMVTGLLGKEKQNWQGKLVRMEASIDTGSNAIQAIARVSQDAEGIPLPIGLYVNATISGREVENIVSLPREVVRGNNRVLVVDTENRLWFRDVDVLRLESDRVLVRGGLADGERICLSPIQTIIDGMRVNVVDNAPATTLSAAY